MTDRVLVESKMADMQAYFEELAEILKNDVRDIVGNNLKLRSVERLFQLVVDTAVDINTHIIATANAAVPDNYQSTFTALAERAMLPMDFALKIAPSVGLRNLVVHRYGRVDVKRMVNDIKHEIGQYREYTKHIDTYVRTL